jgi:hypothetical protein
LFYTEIWLEKTDTMKYAKGIYFIPLLLAACGKAEWPQAEQDALLKGCNRTTGGKTAYCRCALDFSMKRYGIGEFRKLPTASATEQQAFAEQLLAACRTHLLGPAVK